MKNLLLIMALSLSACTPSPKLTVHIDPSIINPEEATVIIYHEDYFLIDTPVMLDRTFQVGIITPEEPIKFSIPPGVHELNTKGRGTNIDRITKMEFIAGRTYFFKAWTEFGAWVASNRITLSSFPVEYYKTISHKKRND